MPVHPENEIFCPSPAQRGGVAWWSATFAEVYTDPEHIPDQFIADLADLDFNDAACW